MQGAARADLGPLSETAAMPRVIHQERDRGISRGIWVALFTAGYMIAVGGWMPVYNETTEDMLLGRDGEVFGIFNGGCGTTFPGIRQPELFTRFLAATFAIGLGPVGQQVIMILITALSLALFDRAARKHFGEDIGWVPAAVLLPIMLMVFVYPIATPGYLCPPTLVASTLGLLYLATTGTTRAACICGMGVAFAGEFHVIGLLGVPVFAMTLFLACRQPIRGPLLGIASAIAAASLMSFNGWVNNAITILRHPEVVALATGALIVVVLIGIRWRPSWQKLDVGQRRRFLLLVIVGSVAAEVMAGAVITRKTAMPHYFLFAFPALAILAGLGLRRLRRFGAAWRVVALAIPMLVLSAHLLFGAMWRFGMTTGTVSLPNYAMREAEILARHFWAKGYTLPDVQRHLRGPHSLDLIGGISVFAPTADGPFERPMSDVRVVTFSKRYRPDGAIPDGGEEVDLGYGRSSWLLPLDGWVRLAPSRACFEPLAGRTERDCVEIESASIEYTGSFRDLRDRSFPALRKARPGIDGGFSRNFTWELPVEITGDDPERHIDIVGLVGTAPWMIARVEGVAYQGDLPARHVVIERSGGRSGRIVLAPAPSRLPLREYPPDFLETRPGETALRKSIRQLPPLGRFACESSGTCPDPLPS